MRIIGSTVNGWNSWKAGWRIAALRKWTLCCYMAFQSGKLRNIWTRAATRL